MIPVKLCVSRFVLQPLQTRRTCPQSCCRLLSPRSRCGNKDCIRGETPICFHSPGSRTVPLWTAGLGVSSFLTSASGAITSSVHVQKKHAESKRPSVTHLSSQLWSVLSEHLEQTEIKWCFIFKSLIMMPQTTGSTFLHFLLGCCL